MNKMDCVSHGSLLECHPALPAGLPGAPAGLLALSALAAAAASGTRYLNRFSSMSMQFP